MACFITGVASADGDVTIVNLTPHQVNLVDKDGKVAKEYPVSGPAARVNVTNTVINTIDGFPLVAQEYGDIVGLPQPKESTYYLVSMVVREAAKKQGRTDVISPDTAPASVVRDAGGNIIGVKQFAY